MFKHLLSVTLLSIVCLFGVERSTPHFSDHRLLFLSLFSLFFKNLGTKGARRATEALRFATRPVFLQTCAY
jgi:uncharacterized membrane protein